MRKIITSILLLLTPTAIQAQSLSDLLKMFSSSTTDTEIVEESEVPKLTSKFMRGEWKFSKLAVDIADDSPIKGFAGVAVVSQIEGLLNSTAANYGIKAGIFIAEFSGNDKASITFTETKEVVNGTYSIDSDANVIYISIGKIDNIEIGTLESEVKLGDGTATFLVDAQILIALADQLPEIAEDSQYQMVKSIASGIDGLLLGFTIQR